MYKFVIVSTVFNKRQISVIKYDECKEDFMGFLNSLRNRNNLVLFPIMNYEDVRNINDLFSSEDLRDFRRDIKAFNPTQKICVVKNYNGNCDRLRSIESVGHGMFKFHTDSKTYISDEVVPLALSISDVEKYKRT